MSAYHAHGHSCVFAACTRCWDCSLHGWCPLFTNASLHIFIACVSEYLDCERIYSKRARSDILLMVVGSSHCHSLKDMLNFCMHFSRLSGETARHDSSEEDSTDSEEEINSPQRITQCQQAEKMDVDGNFMLTSVTILGLIYYSDILVVII